MMFSEMNSNELKEQYSLVSKQYEDYKAQNLKLNMARGKPCSEQMDLSLDMLETVTAKTNLVGSSGDDLRNYGVWDGITEMKDIFADLLQVPAKQVILGNNSSLELMFRAIDRAYTKGYNGEKPWCKLDTVKFLCPVPGYDRHFGITEYFGIEMINIPMNEEGPDMDMVEELVKDDAVKGIWCVPKYANPTGITYSDAVVKRFAKLQPASKDFKIMWDNAYCVHDLKAATDILLDVYAECEKNGTEDMLLIFGSTSKITFAGAGIAAVGASANTFKELEEHFTIQSIGPDKINELRHVMALKNAGGVLDLMKKHREILEPKFDMVTDMLKANVDGIAEWNNPNGGYFVSVNVADNCAKRVVQLCKEAGVVLTGAGATYPYGKDPKDSNIRVAPTFPPVAELKIAMELFCVCVKMATLEKLI